MGSIIGAGPGGGETADVCSSGSPWQGPTGRAHVARHYGHTPTRAVPLWPSARHRTYGRAGPGRAKVERANGVIGGDGEVDGGDGRAPGAQRASPPSARPGQQR